MPQPILNRVLCASLRSGGLVIAIIWLIISLSCGITVLYIYAIYQYFLRYCLFRLIECVGGLIAFILWIFGIEKKTACLMIPGMFWSILSVILGIVEIICSAKDVKFFRADYARSVVGKVWIYLTSIAGIVEAAINIVVFTFFFFVAYSLYISIRYPPTPKEIRVAPLYPGARYGPYGSGHGSYDPSHGPHSPDHGPHV